jgi:hypothetical protein
LTQADKRPVVLIVATGGTIAGVQNDPSDPNRYRAGTLSAEEIVASVPGLAEHARIETVQFSNLASPHITPTHWLGMARLINDRLRERGDIAGVVVTHGTDRLEETAFFRMKPATSKPRARPHTKGFLMISWNSMDLNVRGGKRGGRGAFPSPSVAKFPAPAARRIPPGACRRAG